MSGTGEPQSQAPVASATPTVAGATATGAAATGPSVDIMALAQSISETAHDAKTHLNKRPRLAPALSLPTLPFYDAVGIGLLRLRAELGQVAGVAGNDHAQLEVEVRLGLLIQQQYRRLVARNHSFTGYLLLDADRRSLNVEFLAGVSAKDFADVKTRFSKDVFHISAPVHSTLRINAAGERLATVQSSTGSTQYKEHKEKLAEVNLALLSHDYDLRFAAARETQLPAPAPGLPPAGNPGVERRRRRITYQHKTFTAWQIDLTEVQEVSADGADAGSKQLEVELELSTVGQGLWWELPSDEASLRSDHPAIQSLVRQLLSLLEIVFDAPPPIPAMPPLVAVTDTDVQRAMIACHTEVLQHERGKVDFLGAMPVNCFRASLQVVLDAGPSDYFLTEKTDGTRYLMYVLPREEKCEIYFLDRSRTIYALQKSTLDAANGEIVDVFPSNTVLDGEFVFNFKLQKFVFLIFDVLAWRGMNQMSLPFAQRYDLLQRQVLPRFLTAGMFMRKTFFRLADFRGLLQNIHGHRHRMYIDSDGRHHLTDGLIFQPNLPYTISRDFSLLKWKYADLRSVDLLVSTSSVDLQLFCAGPEKTLINVSQRGQQHVGLPRHDQYRLMAELDDQRRGGGGNATTAIAEVAYDARRGHWTFVKLRPDKVDANFVDAVLGVFIEQAEQLTLDELQYLLTAKFANMEFDYEARLSKLRAQLLDWQRGEARRHKPSK